jgi:hypothetical protein
MIEVTAPVLTLLSLEKLFHLFVIVDKGTALGVLTQECGGKKQLLDYLSKILDPVTRRWPVYPSSSSYILID